MKIRKILSFIFTIPACVMFYIAEKIRGEKVAWRVKEAIEDTTMTCTECEHTSKLKIY